MRNRSSWAAIAAIVAWSIAAIVSAGAQTQTPPAPNSQIPPNPQIDVAYVPPSDPALMKIYQALKDRKVLETLQQFLSPLQLPAGTRLSVKFNQCGAPSSPYKSGGQVTLCYEYVAQVQQSVPKSAPNLTQGSVTPEATLIGPVVQEMLHETALGVFDVLKVPVWGRIDDAADRLSAYLMVQFGPDIAWNAIVGTAWFLATQADAPPDFSSISGVVAQRYYTTVCIAIGAQVRKAFTSNLGSFLSFVGNQSAGQLPASRAQSCPNEYDAVNQAFIGLFLKGNHVNTALLDQVRKANWVNFGG